MQSEEILPKSCYHCGEPCEDVVIQEAEKSFCCQGCKAVYDILSSNDLCQYYELNEEAGIPQSIRGPKVDFASLDLEAVQESLVEFRNEEIAKTTFSLPQIHCTSCIWLLEELTRLHTGILESRVNFLRRELYITFHHSSISLRELAELLSSIGYPPDVHLDAMDQTEKKPGGKHSLLIKLGVAGFCFGNIMLLSFPDYLGLEDSLDEGFAGFFILINCLLACIVVGYSATPFFRSAWQGLKHRNLTLDVPIVLGIIALFTRSLVDLIWHHGPGYWDSLAGLVFLLLIGKWVQRRTYDALAFDRDFTAYFPLSANKLQGEEEIPTLVSELKAGDEILIRHQELIPADAILLSDHAEIDFGFVTGESEPVLKTSGDLIYAGGRQMGQTIRLRLTKTASQSYLTRLWTHASFKEDMQSQSRTLADRMSRAFTGIVLLLATLAAIYWGITTNIETALEVFTAVLIVACPCGLALCSPITLGLAMYWMGKRGLYLKSSQVIERMAQISHIIFDKTGTLSFANVSTERTGEAWNPADKILIRSVANQSTHPVSRALANSLNMHNCVPVTDFQEYPGMGVKGSIGDHRVAIGRKEFVEGGSMCEAGSGTWVTVDGRLLGEVKRQEQFRPGLASVLRKLARSYSLSILSGDAPKALKRLAAYLPAGTHTYFDQHPEDKLEVVQDLQEAGEQVLMVGDGLNDAGAFRQSDVGIALTDSTHAFVPACDAIFDGSEFEQLPKLLTYSKGSMRLVRLGLLISLLYNVIGLGFAIQGLLSPLIAAVLMPLSSLTVIGFALISTWILANRARIIPQEQLSIPGVT